MISSKSTEGARKLLSRRSFITALTLAAVPGVRALEEVATNRLAAAQNRKLAFRVKMNGFGGAREADIKAVLRSAADEIWRHCPHTRFEPAGFEIYHDSRYPITHYERAKDGFVVIGLAVEGNLWARFSYQFAHEFAHALMDHANCNQARWRDPTHANQWFEESLCEMASLYALSAMAATWRTTPPYPNWKSYAPSLADYVSKHLAEPTRQLPKGRKFLAWFRDEEPSLRQHATQRDKNTIIARHLLPLFQAEPRGWESLPSLKLGVLQADKPFARLLAEWHTNAPAAQRSFVEKLAALFGVKP